MLINDPHIVAPWVMERTGDDFPMGVQAAIGYKDGDTITAGVVFDHYTGPCVTATIAVDHKRLPRQLIHTMFAYPFKQLGVKKIIVYVNESNHESYNLAERLGFQVEAVIGDVYDDGDMLIMTMNKSDCSWLRR